MKTVPVLRFARPAFVAMVAALMVGALIGPHPTVLAAGCSGGAGGHYYTVAQSGSDTTIGTGAQTTTWTHWSVANNGVNFSDEAVWISNQSNGNNALEGGFYSGSGSNVPWTNGLLPYYTTNNGQNEYDDAGQYLPSNTSIWLNVTSAYNGSGAFVGVGSNNMYPGNYSVSTPAQNFSQGEVYNNSGVWMGGGSGETFDAKWEDTHRNFYSWGFNNDCADSPYFINNNSPSSWTSGGY